jgi:hypothetical protein
MKLQNMERSGAGERMKSGSGERCARWHRLPVVFRNGAGFPKPAGYEGAYRRTGSKMNAYNYQLAVNTREE